MNLNYLDNFGSYLRRRRRDESTIASYVSDAQGYIDCMGGRLAFSPDLMLDFIGHMDQRRLSAATIQRRAIAVTQFWRFAFGEGLTDQFPVTLADLGVKLSRSIYRTIPLCPDDFDLLLTELANALNEVV